MSCWVCACFSRCSAALCSEPVFERECVCAHTHTCACEFWTCMRESVCVCARTCVRLCVYEGVYTCVCASLAPALPSSLPVTLTFHVEQRHDEERQRKDKYQRGDQISRPSALTRPAPACERFSQSRLSCAQLGTELSHPLFASGVCDLTCPIALARPCPAVLPDGQDRCAAARASRPHSASLCVGARALGARAHATAAVPPSLSVHCARIETVSQDRDQNANGGVTVLLSPHLNPFFACSTR